MRPIYASRLLTIPASEAAKEGLSLPYWVHDESKCVTYHMRVIILPPDELDRLCFAARKWAAVNRPNPNDNRAGNLDYEPTDREKLGLIRHCLINRSGPDQKPSGYRAGWDWQLARLKECGHADWRERQMEFKRLGMRLIAEAYPDLAVECDDYIFRCERMLVNEL